MHKIKTLGVILVAFIGLMLVFGNVSFTQKTNVAVGNIGSNVVFIDSDVPYTFSMNQQEDGHHPSQSATEQQGNALWKVIGLVVFVIIVLVGVRMWNHKPNEKLPTKEEVEWWDKTEWSD